MVLLEAEPRAGGAADHDQEEQNQQQRVVVRSAANFRLRDFIFEKVVFVLVVALPFPMLGSHPPRKKKKRTQCSGRAERWCSTRVGK